LTNFVITSSSSSESIWPWPMTRRAFGQSFFKRSAMSWIVSTRLCRKKTWPPRPSSRWMASRMMPFVELGHDGLDGQAVVRGRLDGAHVARAGEREVKRARDRRGAQRQHVHERAQALEFLLVQHAEALLLVNHDQAQVFENNVVLHQPVRANDDVHRASRQVFDDSLLFARGAKTREQLTRTG